MSKKEKTFINPLALPGLFSLINHFALSATERALSIQCLGPCLEHSKYQYIFAEIILDSMFVKYMSDVKKCSEGRDLEGVGNRNVCRIRCNVLLQNRNSITLSFMKQLYICHTYECIHLMYTMYWVLAFLQSCMIITIIT